MRIQHNIMAMNAYRNYTNNASALSKNLEKLSSGYKINRAGDDAAGLAISEKMRAQITGLDAAQKNAKDGISLVKTAEGALAEVHDMLNRMAYLATQSANGTYDDETDRDQLQKEVNQLREEINRIADSSNFNGIKLLDGSMGGKPSAIKIDGVDSTKINAAAGKTTSAGKLIEAQATATYGDTFTYTVALDNGKSYTGQFKIVKANDDANNLDKAYLVDVKTGKKLDTVMDSTKGLTADTIGKALAKSLKATDLADDFGIKWDEDADQFVFKNLTPGDKAVTQIKALDYEYVLSGTKTVKADAPGLSEADDDGFVIDVKDIKLYDGENYDDAVFTINGHKFVMMTKNINGKDTTGNNADSKYLRAVAALGSDVTVLVCNDADKKGLVDGDPNKDQNWAKIEEVTGLTVQGVTTATGDAYDFLSNEGGIKLLLGDGKAANGLKLQIGDTADSYNQLEVSINDCHTKALGIDMISIANQESAAVAIDTIRSAINYISDVRGTLGATQNRLEHTINNLSVMAENIQDAESTIRDTDVAEEMMSYVKNNILVQSAQAMLAQANQVPQGVLQLLG